MKNNTGEDELEGDLRGQMDNTNRTQMPKIPKISIRTGAKLRTYSLVKFAF
jgi:hypothetical protein